MSGFINTATPFQAATKGKSKKKKVNPFAKPGAAMKPNPFAKKGVSKKKPRAKK